MGSSHYIISELAQIEGELMGYHEGLDMMGKEANLSNLSSGLLEQSKKLNKIAKDIIGMESDWKKKVEELEKRIKELETPSLPDWSKYQQPTRMMMFDPECLHNGCQHERNPVCNLYCPHCAPRC